MDETTTPSLMEALAAAGCPPAPEWMDTEEVGDDGFLVAMPEEEKRRDQLALEYEYEQEAREAERDGDHHRATWAREQASHERRARTRRTPNRQPRPRGAGRPKVHSSARRSSERSGDSGDSEGSEPPDRPCACGCRADISHRAPQAKYLNDAHAAADRQRRKRSRDWDSDVPRSDPYLRVDAEEAAHRRRIEGGCRCNGHHIADAADGHCIKCGHDRAGGAVFAGFISARSAETRRPRTPEVFA